MFYVYGLLFACPLFENVPLSVIQSDKGTSDVDPFIPINRGITDREILISITGLYFGYPWFIFPRKMFFVLKRILLQCNKINIFGDFENITPTHIGAAHAFSKFSKSNSQGIGPKL